MILFCIGIGIIGELPAHALPNVLNFHSELTEGGGAPLPSGEANLTFRILNSKQEILFSEDQSLDVIDGKVNALIGNGIDPTFGTPSGGISEDVFDTEEPRLLEILIDGKTYDNPMEIASTPYAFICGKANDLSDEAITFSHFQQNTINELVDVVADNFALGTPQAASAVGINNVFSNSFADNVQDVISDLDKAISNRIDKTGDTMKAALKMGGNKISDVGYPSSNNDAASKVYADNLYNSTLQKTTSLQNEVNDLKSRLTNIEARPQILAMATVNCSQKSVNQYCVITSGYNVKDVLVVSTGAANYPGVYDIHLNNILTNANYSVNVGPEGDMYGISGVVESYSSVMNKSKSGFRAQVYKPHLEFSFILVKS